MSNLLVCISVRDKQDEGIKKMCSTGISFGRSKLLQSCSNFTLKPELKPTVTACLAGRDAQEVLYTGFVHTLSSDSKRLRFLPDICNADIEKTSFSSKTYTLFLAFLSPPLPPLFAPGTQATNLIQVFLLTLLFQERLFLSAEFHKLQFIFLLFNHPLPLTTCQIFYCHSLPGFIRVLKKKNTFNSFKIVDLWASGWLKIFL